MWFLHFYSRQVEKKKKRYQASTNFIKREFSPQINSVKSTIGVFHSSIHALASSGNKLKSATESWRDSREVWHTNFPDIFMFAENRVRENPYRLRKSRTFPTFFFFFLYYRSALVIYLGCIMKKKKKIHRDEIT